MVGLAITLDQSAISPIAHQGLGLELDRCVVLGNEIAKEDLKDCLEMVALGPNKRTTKIFFYHHFWFIPHVVEHT